jgi:hypothetical protein
MRFTRIYLLWSSGLWCLVVFNPEDGGDISFELTNWLTDWIRGARSLRFIVAFVEPDTSPYRKPLESTPTPQHVS